MKKLLFVCLLAASHSLHAQNIDLSEIESLLSKSSMDSIDDFLITKGFQKAKIQAGTSTTGLQLKQGWYFRPESSAEAKSITMLGRLVDSSGKTFYRLETSNPFFYSHLMNQLPENLYSYKGTIAKEKEANLVFSNMKNEIVIRISSEFKVQYQYQINIGVATSDIGYFKPRKTALKAPTAKPKTKKTLKQIAR